MYQFFVEPFQIDETEKSVIIRGGDVNHIKNVLRMRIGEELSVSNGQDGREYRCGIKAFSEDGVECEIRFVKQNGAELPCKIFLFQGLPKADKMEWIIQKAVELGVYRVIPVETERCVVRLDEKKAKNRVARWQAISQAAAKQSKRGIIPEIALPVSFSEAVRQASAMDVRMIPYEMAEGMDSTRELIEAVEAGQSIAVFIGPEGGFTREEIAFAQEHGIRPVTLGKRILRTETAGMIVVSWLMYQLER